MTQMPIMITIDGPAAAGKTTVAQRLARHLGYVYLESGALYRAVAWQAAADRVNLAEPSVITSWSRTLTVDLKQTARGPKVLVNRRDVTSELGRPELRGLASQLSAVPAVRDRLLTIQRDLGRQGGVVAEGRDMGTVVFPQADVKFYLDARLEVRGERRRMELEAQGVRADLATTLEDIRTRDARDTTRAVAPLRLAPDAVMVDSSGLTEDAVVEDMLSVIEARVSRRLGPGHDGDSLAFRILAGTLGTLGYGLLYATFFLIGKLFFRLTVRGQRSIPRRGGVLIAANHMSYLDIPLLGCSLLRRADFVGRDDLFRLPVIGWLYRLMGGIPVKRHGVGREWLAEAVRRLRAGRVVVMYPEGTRGPGDRFLDPKPGIGVLAAQAGVPVIPALIQGTDKALPRGAWRPSLSAVTVTFGEPIDFGALVAQGIGPDVYAGMSREIMRRIAGLALETQRVTQHSGGSTMAIMEANKEGR